MDICFGAHGADFDRKNKERLKEQLSRLRLDKGHY